MNNGAFGEGFPYTNFHDLNLDWMIKIAKDFLDQYTHIQDTIDQGLEDLQTKYENLETLLDEWYDTHSQDIANELADALEDIQTALTNAITAFGTAAEAKAAEVIASIPADYTQLANDVEYAIGNVNSLIAGLPETTIVLDGITWEDGYLDEDGLIVSGANYKTSSLIYVPAGYVCRFNSSASAATFSYQIYDQYGDFDSTGEAGHGITLYDRCTRYSDSDQYIRICTNTTTVTTDQVAPTLYNYSYNDILHPEIIHLRPAIELGYIKDDGTVVIDSTYIHTSNIKIPKGYMLSFNTDMSGSAYHFVNTDNTGAFVSAGIIGGTAGRINVYAYEADRYIKAVTKTYYTYAAIDMILKPIDMDIVYTRSDFNNNLGTIRTTALNFGNGYFSSSTGELVSTSNYMYSGIIFLAKGQTFEGDLAGSAGAYLLIETTKGFAFVQGLVTGNNEYRRIKYKADHDMFIRFCSRIDNLVHTPFIAEDDLKDNWTVRYFHSSSKLAGKNIVVIGDSLIYGNNCGNGATWCEILKNKTGANVYNYGVNGSTIANVADHNPMCIRYADISELPTADIVIIEGGANDYNQDVPMGTTSSDDTTFNGAIVELVNGIRTLNPTAYILFMTTYHRNQGLNSLSLSLRQYATNSQETCNYLSVPCYNTYNDSGLLYTISVMRNWIDEGIYLGLSANNHISPKAYNYIYPKYLAWIENNC